MQQLLPISAVLLLSLVTQESDQQTEFRVGELVQVTQFEDEWDDGIITKIEDDNASYRIILYADRGSLSFIGQQASELLALRYSRAKIRKHPLNAAREWVDQTGKFKKTATLIDVYESRAFLLDSDGKEIKVPIKRLSADDKKFVKQWQQYQALIRPRLLISDADFTAVKTITLDKSTVWNPEPDPFSASDKVPVRSIRVDMPDGFDFTAESVMLDSSRTKALVFFRNTFELPFEAKRYIAVFDLVQGKAIGSFQIPVPGHAPESVSPNCQQLLTSSSESEVFPGGRYEFGRYERGKVLHVWQATAKGIKHVRGWIPFVNEGPEQMVIAVAKFIDDETILVVSEYGKAIVWDAATGKAIWQIDVNSENSIDQNSVQLSPGAKYLLLPAVNDLWIIETKNGDVTGRLPAIGAAIDSIALTDDGTKLAVKTNNYIKFYDFRTGTKDSQFTIKTPFSDRALSWLDPRFVIVSQPWGASLLDSVKQVEVWNYLTPSLNSSPPVVIANNVIWFAHIGGDNLSLVPSEIPVADVIEHAEKYDPDKMQVYGQGASVSLQFDLPSTEQDTASLKQKIIQRLQNDQISVDPDSKLVLTFKIKKGNQFAVRYRAKNDRSFHSGTIQQIRHVVTLTENGIPIWSNNITIPEYVKSGITLDRGETLQQRLDKLTRPRLSFFPMLLPGEIQRLKKPFVRGISSIDENGKMKDVANVTPPR